MSWSTRVARSGAVALAVAFALAIAPGATSLQAQVSTTELDPLGRALAAEDKGQMREAASAYRDVLQRALAPGAIDGERIALALLGLERVWSETGARDSILPVVERVLLVRRTDPVARGIQLRQLVGLGRDADARAAFLDWRRAAPTDATPFREYANLLITGGRALAADSVLADAARYIGGGAIAGELAQLHVALERWQPAASAFRRALESQPWLETSALFGLSRAPITERDSIRAVLNANPVVLAPRRLLSTLEMTWGEPRKAWLALSALRADDSTTAAWRAFGERAEMAESWVVARDVWLAVLGQSGDAEAQQRAAEAAINAGDAVTALEIVRRPMPAMASATASPAASAGSSGKGNAKTVATDPNARLRVLLPIEIRALGELGRASEAEQLIETKAAALDVFSRRTLARPMVSAWLRAGNLDKARSAAKLSDLSDDDEISGWLALYEGDLVEAKRRLVRAETRNPSLNDALGLLARTRVTSSPALGNAFMLLARRDSAGAAASFAKLADSIPDAAPALLSLSARLENRIATPESKARAIALWERITTSYAKSPEAPESLLAWARALIAADNKAAAQQRLEQLLIGYPDSALLPQARRELEQLKGQIPPDAPQRGVLQLSGAR